jgi:hemerythrin
MDIHTLLTVRDEVNEKLSFTDKYEEPNTRAVLTELLNWVNDHIEQIEKIMEKERGHN